MQRILVQARIRVQARNHGDRPYMGDGEWVVNHAKGQAVQDIRFHDGPIPVFAYMLFRYDLGKSYEIDSHDRVSGLDW